MTKARKRKRVHRVARGKPKPGHIVAHNRRRRKGEILCHKHVLHTAAPEMYAMFPMIAVQRYLGESGADTHFDDQRQQGTFLDVGRYFFIYGAGARFADTAALTRR
jgi:hypothetical protein